MWQLSDLRCTDVSQKCLHASAVRGATKPQEIGGEGMDRSHGRGTKHLRVKYLLPNCGR